MPLNDIQRRQRKAKDSERKLGRHLIENDGPDPHMMPGNGIVSTTGRVGMITGLQYDVRSKTYAAENKQVKMPAILFDWWLQICQVAKGQFKEPLLRWEPSNDDAPRGIEPMVIITQSRHADLLAYEKVFTEKQEEAARSTTSGFTPYSKEAQLKNSKPRGGKK